MSKEKEDDILKASELAVRILNSMFPHLWNKQDEIRSCVNLGVAKANISFDESKGVSYFYWLKYVGVRTAMAYLSAKGMRLIGANYKAQYLTINETDYFSNGFSTLDSVFPEKNKPKNTEKLFDKIEKILSRKESEVLYCWKRGLSYDEIAVECDISNKSVDNTLCRIKRKVAERKSLKQEFLEFIGEAE